jgi:hypothetical protein
VSNDLFTIEIVDGEEDEDEDEDEDEEMESEAQYDGIDDGDDEDDEDDMTMEEIEARQAAEEAKEAAASKAAQESTEISKMMEKTQLNAEATTAENESSASRAKDEVSTMPAVVAGRKGRCWRPSGSESPVQAVRPEVPGPALARFARRRRPSRRSLRDRNPQARRRSLQSSCRGEQSQRRPRGDRPRC